jgi:hypothetical protein
MKLVLGVINLTVKVNPITCHEEQVGSRGIALLFPQPRRWIEVLNATPRPLYPRE